ncbi:hypothetical protein ACFVUS_28475 [Nocardia sp. NPDC058058]|uniref:hypothetical protein n=1 Tax=Nocardia sp. NPDC058058 TaxID=3346317 RepID=UPI0036DA68A0
MIKDWPVPSAVIYIVGSILIGPAIAVGGYVITSANGDFCDLGPHGSSGQRDRDYAVVEGIQITGSIVMLTVGLFLLIALWANHVRTRRSSLWLTSIGILLMMAGYLLVLIMGTVADPRC